MALVWKHRNVHRVALPATSECAGMGAIAPVESPSKGHLALIIMTGAGLVWALWPMLRGRRRR